MKNNIYNSLTGNGRAGRIMFAAVAALVGTSMMSYATSIDDVIADQGTNESNAHPHGVPYYYDWYNGANFQPDNVPNGNTANILGYGQLYELDNLNFASDAWVEIRNARTFVKHRDGSWTEVYDTSGFEGAGYPEDFNGNTVAPDRTVIDGYTAARAGSQSSTGSGYNFHFWTDARPSIDPNDTVGVYFEYEARVVGSDSANALYLMDAGVDYYAADYGPMQGSAGQGRWKFVVQDWRTFTFTNISADTFRADPPPNVQ